MKNRQQHPSRLFRDIPSVFLLVIFPFLSNISAQNEMKIVNACNFKETIKKDIVNIFDASKESEKIVLQIVEVIGLGQNFTLKAADVTNALATTQNNQRFILYSTVFLENFKKESKTKWAAFCVLAHEVGHHLNNHNLGETDNKKRKKSELQADFFAGNVLSKLGATLEEAQAGINTFSLEGESDTHPPKSARLEALASGWKKDRESKEDLDPVFTNDNCYEVYNDNNADIIYFYDETSYTNPKGKLAVGTKIKKQLLSVDKKMMRFVTETGNTGWIPFEKLRPCQ